LCATTPAILRAQGPTGTITGAVTVAGTSQPAVGAQVFVPSTRQGGQANDVGVYTIRNVPAGNVTIRVQMIGFEPVEQTVNVVAGGTATANVSIHRTAVSLSEVVV